MLESVPFAPSLPVVEEDETTNLLYENFIFEIPQVPGVAAVQILDQTILLTNFTVPPPAPSVQFSSPLPGASLPSGAINLSWTASDPYAGVPLTYLLEYSSDGGNNWETFAMDLTNSQYSLTSDELSGTTNGYFQVTASDGYNAAVAQTGPLTVPYQPPTIEIDSPLPGDVYVYGESIILRASAWDMVDGDLTNSLYQWTDSLGGSLGTSNEISLDVSGLEPGTHVFSVSVTNSAGLEASTNVCITVDESLPVPLTAALAGNDEIQLSWPDAESTLQVWATFSLDEPSWFLVEGVPTDDCVNQTMILDVPMVEDTLYFSLAPP